MKAGFGVVGPRERYLAEQRGRCWGFADMDTYAAGGAGSSTGGGLVVSFPLLGIGRPPCRWAAIRAESAWAVFTDAVTSGTTVAHLDAMR